jgi:hypothetical protein
MIKLSRGLTRLTIFKRESQGEALGISLNGVKGLALGGVKKLKRINPEVYPI